MTVDAGVETIGSEWSGSGEREQRADAQGWPIIPDPEICDGQNPMTGRPCHRGYHQGYHRDVSGAEWLDD